MLTELTGQDLPQWSADASDAWLPGISSFAKGAQAGPRRRHQRPDHALELGPVEGRVNHIKMIKRRMLGRAGLPLLRKRVLLTARS
jgi:transposase